MPAPTALTDGQPHRRRRALGWLLVAGGSALGIAALVVAPGLTGAPQAGPSPSPTLTSWAAADAHPSTYAGDVVAATNSARADEGLAPLVASACAQDQALARAEGLTGDRPLEHAPLEPVMAACPPASQAAENLSRAAAGPQDVVDAWLDSPGHRANLLDPDLDQVGVACLLDGDRMLCSQVFLGS